MTYNNSSSSAADPELDVHSKQWQQRDRQPTRFLLGALNGLVATAKTMISEVCGSEHETVGMSFVTGCWSVGLVLGSGLGGVLAEPAKNYPAMFSESGIFGRFPYLPPNILGAVLALIGLPMVFFFLDETLDAHKSGDRPGFKAIPTPEAEFNNHAEAAHAKGDVRAISLDSGYDPQLTSGRGARTTAGSGSGGKPGCLAAGTNRRSDICSTQARVEEQLPLVEQRPRSPSVARKLEGEHLLSILDGAHRSTSSGVSGIEEDEGVDGGGFESRRGWWRIGFLQECLLPMKLLEQRRVRSILFVYVLFSFLIIGFDEAYPLWTISSVASGGLDWTTPEVGQVLAACGGGMLIFQLLIYPWIVEQIGTTRSQRWSCCISFPVFFAYPFLSRIQDSEGVLMTASLVLLFLTNVAGNAFFINTSLAINNAVDTSQRGTINGLMMMLGSLATGAGPIVFSTIFAWSINRPRPFPLDSHLVFCLLSLGMFIVTITSWNIVTSSDQPKPKSETETFSPPPVVVVEDAAGGYEENGLSSGT
eukprot:jgi/Undpi1/2655/HiC_scaffold_13.g06033.m1